MPSEFDLFHRFRDAGRPYPAQQTGSGTWSINPQFRYIGDRQDILREQFEMRHGFSPSYDINPNQLQRRTSFARNPRDIPPFPQAWTTDNQEAPWITEAKKYVGMHEVEDNAQLSGLLNCDPSVTPWCADYVNSVLGKSGIKGSGSMLARSFKDWGQPVNSVPGAVSFGQRHAEFVIDPNRKHIGGNLGDRVRMEHDPSRWSDFRYPEGIPVPQMRPTPDEIHQHASNLPQQFVRSPQLGITRIAAEQALRRMLGE